MFGFYPSLYPVNFGQDRFYRVTGEDTHVHTEHVLAGDGVDIGDIGFLFGGMEGRVIRFKEGIVIAEFFGKPVVEPDRKVSSGQVGVGALIRP
jgi:hypothetical protein